MEYECATIIIAVPLSPFLNIDRITPTLLHKIENNSSIFFNISHVILSYPAIFSFLSIFIATLTSSKLILFSSSCSTSTYDLNKFPLSSLYVFSRLLKHSLQSVTKLLRPVRLIILLGKENVSPLMDFVSSAYLTGFCKYNIMPVKSVRLSLILRCRDITKSLLSVKVDAFLSNFSIVK